MTDPLWDELCERVNSLTLRNNVLELENDKLREAAQAVVDSAGRKGKRLKYQTEYTVKADIVDALAALNQSGSE